MFCVTCKKTVYAPVPLPTKAQPLHLGLDPKQHNILYCVGNSVVVRSVENFSVSSLYQQHSHSPTVARYAPSGFYIASADIQGKVRIWDTTQAENILKNEFHLISGEILDMVWSEDSKRIAVVGKGKERYGAVVFSDTGASVGEISGHSKTINTVDLKQNRPYRLVTGSEDLSVNFFEGPPFKFKFSIREYQRYINSVRFSPNGEYFVTVSSDKKIVIFDGKTANKVGEVISEHNHKMGIMNVAWSSDSKKFVTVSTDSTAKIWSVDEMKLIHTIELNDGQLLGVLWYNSFIIVLSLSGCMHFIDHENYSIVKSMKGHNRLITSLAYDSQSNTFFSGDFNARVLQWNISNGEANFLSGCQHGGQVSCLKAHNSLLYSISMDDTLKISNISSLTWGESVKLNLQPLDLAVSSSNAVFIVGSKNILSYQNGKLTSLQVEFEPVSVAVSPTSELAVGARNSKIYVYKIDKDQLTFSYTCEGHRHEVTTLDYSGDGKLASGDANREVIIWNGTNRISNGWVYHTARVNCVAWSPDNTHLASVGIDSNLIIWNSVNQENRMLYRNAHYGGANKVVWISPNMLVTGGKDCSLKKWSIQI